MSWRSSFLYLSVGASDLGILADSLGVAHTTFGKLMSVHTFSLYALMKQSRKLERAYQQQNWDEFQRLDPILMGCIKKASEDPFRNPAELLTEIKSVVSLYRQMTALSQREFLLPHQ